MTDIANMPDQKTVMQEAVKAKRQPICVHCKHPLDRVVQETQINWEWNDYTNKYDLFIETAVAPMHMFCHDCEDDGTECDASDEEYLDGTLISKEGMVHNYDCRDKVWILFKYGNDGARTGPYVGVFATEARANHALEKLEALYGKERYYKVSSVVE